jgi:hypothetical protein
MMRAMRAESFTKYGGLKLVEVPTLSLLPTSQPRIE